MEKAVNFVALTIIAPFYWTHLARRALAERTTIKFLQSLTETSLLLRFGDVLKKSLSKDLEHYELIFDKFAFKSAGKEPVWTEESFTRFVNATSGCAVEGLIPLLWRCFSRAAYFPLNPLYAANSSWRVELDLHAFHRAFSLLVLQGIQLLGFDLDWTGGQIPHDYQKKVFRIARFILTCATSRTYEENVSEKQKGLEDLTEVNVLDVVDFTQPPTYRAPIGDMINRSSIPPRAFWDAARRLVEDAKRRSDYMAVHPEISRSDLQSLLQLTLLVGLQTQRWRNGHLMPVGYGPITADVQYSSLDLDHVPGAEKLASNFLAWYFPHEGDRISFNSLKSFCSECPMFVFLFFHVWASLFSVGSKATQHQTSGKTYSVMPQNIVNLLSLLGIVKPDDDPFSQGRYFAKELHVNVELQISRLALNDIEGCRQTTAALKSTLTTGSYFHIILVQGHDIISGPPDKDREQSLLAIFISPRDQTRVIWHSREGANFGSTWRYSYVNILPETAIVHVGPISVDEDDHSREVVLVADGEEHTESIRLDMDKRVMTSKARKIQWTALRCFRMPETAQVMRHPSMALHTSPLFSCQTTGIAY